MQFIKVDHHTVTAVIMSQLKIQEQTFSKTCENELYTTYHCIALFLHFKNTLLWNLQRGIYNLTKKKHIAFLSYLQYNSILIGRAYFLKSTCVLNMNKIKYICQFIFFSFSFITNDKFLGKNDSYPMNVLWALLWGDLFYEIDNLAFNL